MRFYTFILEVSAQKNKAVLLKHQVTYKYPTRRTNR